MTEIKILIVILFLIPPLNSYSQKVPGLSTGKGFSITPQITYVSSATIQLDPFSTDLIIAGRDIFRYELIWDKHQGSNMYEAKKRPLKSHENILIFNKSNALYLPQMTPALSKNMRDRVKNKFKGVESGVYGKMEEYIPQKNENERYPLSVYYHSSQGLELHKTKRVHNTQKPLQLTKWLVSSYSNENDMVLDNTMGSGTTCLAAKELNRKFIGIEKEPKYYEIACKRCGF